MTKTSALIRTSTLITLSDYFEVFGSVPEDQIDPVKQEEAKQVLLKFLDAQKIDPYRGWDLDKLGKVRQEIREMLKSFGDDEPYSKEMMFIGAVENYGSAGETGFNITSLSRIADKARAYLGMPSVHDLNPDIKRLSDRAKNFKFFQDLNSESSAESSIPLRDALRFSAFNEDRTLYRIIAQDDNSRSVNDTVLPEDMLKAGEKVLMENYSVHPAEARSAAIEVFRAMSDATPRFDHFDNLKNIRKGESG